MTIVDTTKWFKHIRFYPGVGCGTLGFVVQVLRQTSHVVSGKFFNASRQSSGLAIAVHFVE